MILKLQRYSDSGTSTLGLLTINNEFLCYTLEDTYRADKIKGVTRIPAGHYDIELRTEGGFHERYSKRFTDHSGMLQLKDVPDFQYILIHCGNTAADTAGCLLLGNNVFGRDKITDSTGAYKAVYPIIRDALLRGENVSIDVRDECFLG